MANQTRKSDYVTHWDTLIAKMVANADDLAHLEPSRAKLATILEEYRTLTTEQGRATADKQDASKRLQELVVNGRRLATVLRSSLREHYGIRSEKLAEFSLQPFRGRKRSTNGEAPPAPGSPGTTPAPGTTPGTTSGTTPPAPAGTSPPTSPPNPSTT